MTRLIDADELKAQIPTIEDEYKYVHKLIDSAPTVETDIEVVAKDAYEHGYADGWKERFGEPDGRPKGEWIQTEVIDDDSDYGVNADASECSNCKHIENSHYWTTTYYNFCPNCGADMRKGEENEQSEDNI